MLNKALICILMLVVVFGCANQQKDTAEKQTEEAQQTEQPEQAKQAEQAEETQQADADAAFEEISLTVTGMT